MAGVKHFITRSTKEANHESISGRYPFYQLPEAKCEKKLH